MVLSDEFLTAMTGEELFFLAVACHYHDLAMAGTEADDRSAEAREQVRRDHAVRIGDCVREKWAELGFENMRWAVVLGEVCRGHRPKKNAEGEANWDELKNTEVLGPGVAVRVRLLSALIYAIDELHLGADRAPERVQNWRNIQDDNDRRHWRRHQAISGPVSHPPSTLLFQVSADTPAFEEYLRSQVFLKAFSALRDLRRQANTEHVVATLPSVTIQWERHTMWEMLLPVVCSDMRPCSRDEIVQAIIGRFRQDTRERVGLDSVCAESGNAEAELASSAGRIVDDAVTKRHLIAASGPAAAYMLSALPTHADTFFNRAREADDLDLLFVGRYRHSWEQELFASEFGRGYVCRSVFPAVERAYSVRVTQRPPTDPVRLLLESCPTASRLVCDHTPSADNLVKESLLAQAVVTGALIDLHSDPERLLEGPVRAAVRALTADNGTVAPTVRLLEELALLGGFTHEQLSAAVIPSEAAQAAMIEQNPTSGKSILIHMTQSMPSDATGTTYLPRLLLASKRAGTPILLTAAADHNFTLRVEGDTELANRDTTGVVVEVGSVAAHRPASFQMPARVEVSQPTRTIRLLLRRFSGDTPTAYPVVMTIPVPPVPGQRVQVTFGTAIQWPELTVRDWRALEEANQVTRSSGARMELIVEDGDRQLATMEIPQGVILFELGTGSENVQRALSGLDGESPAPVRVTPDDFSEIANMTPANRETRWQAERDRGSDPSRRVSSVFLRLATPEGHPFEEQFLRFLPFTWFPAPTFGTEDPAKTELRRQWTEGEIDFLLTCCYHTDIHELAMRLQNWCQNPQGGFPFRFYPGGMPEPVTRSVLTVRLLRSRDRIWYRDRPIIFEFRPVNRKEAYQMEASYWRSMGDEQRAQLAQEICEREVPQV
ncbi:MAG TPA: hypothetical protein VEL76_29325 [Gemmataceae bacterium]|nr:hypothetical protein [Gemmataceae bacterium]